MKQQTGQWIFSFFVEEHNHVVATLIKVHLLRPHTNVSTTKRKFWLSNYSEQIYQYINKWGSLKLNLGVFKILIGFFFLFFKRKTKNVLHFILTLNLMKQTLVRCFWLGLFTRRSYDCFGDVVVFNTTYSTNVYSMIFAPFSNVNHHGQTIIFGCTFFNGEKTKSSIWLFTKLLDVMVKVAPQVIIID